MVVLRMGGVYTDRDVECRKPLDQLIQPSDALIAGWEAEFPNATIARISEYTRKRQVPKCNLSPVGNCLLYCFLSRRQTRLLGLRPIHAHVGHYSMSATFCMMGLGCEGAAVDICGRAWTPSTQRCVRAHQTTCRQALL